MDMSEIQPVRLGPEDSEKFATFTPEQVSGILHVGERTLRNWRSEGIGPRYVRIGSDRAARGGTVLYRADALLEYMDANTVDTDVLGTRAPKRKRGTKGADGVRTSK